MSNSSATAFISARVAAIKAAREAVFKESAQRLVAVMQTPGPSVANPDGGRGGALPIDTGFLRTSLQAVIGSSPPVSRDRPSEDLTYSYDAGEVNLVIAMAGIEDTITVAYTANYARFANYRYQFVGLAVQRWPGIVGEVEREVKARLGL